MTLSTDIITGFPGETEEDHRGTVELLEQVRPDIINVTRFSPRHGHPGGQGPETGPRVGFQGAVPGTHQGAVRDLRSEECGIPRYSGADRRHRAWKELHLGGPNPRLRAVVVPQHLELGHGPGGRDHRQRARRTCSDAFSDCHWTRRPTCQV